MDLEQMVEARNPGLLSTGDNASNLQPLSLVDQVEEARLDKIAEQKRKDVTQVDVWVTASGFVSPYPDRVIIYKCEDARALLDACYKVTSDDPIIPGSILVLEEGLLFLTQKIFEEMSLELGYIHNPDQEWDSWAHFTRNVKSIDSLDIGSIFEPLHLPDPSTIDVEDEVQISSGMMDDEEDEVDGESDN